MDKLSPDRLWELKYNKRTCMCSVRCKPSAVLPVSPYPAEKIVSVVYKHSEIANVFK